MRSELASMRPELVSMRPELASMRPELVFKRPELVEGRASTDAALSLSKGSTFGVGLAAEGLLIS
ncbi:MAG TPA: hypothetical protein VJ625_13835 [Propionibacteriaceae bacterium]|nr:hypothetical protein [Propionibacteriaceae bacterium]